jgi:hypothetical protein
MAFLIAATGRGDLVDRVARTRNNAYLPELLDEPGLREWLEEHGITATEAARIQPSYDGPGWPGYGNQAEHRIHCWSAATSGLPPSDRDNAGAGATPPGRVLGAFDLVSAERRW